MDELLYREEMMGSQRSRIAWLMEGDHNTKFFHRKAAARAKKNTIKRLRSDDNQVTQDREEMEVLTTNFFKNLYTTDSVVQHEKVVQQFQSIIMEEMNVGLCKEFSPKEISNALFPAQVFQKNWTL
jgi:hypothetical protein